MIEIILSLWLGFSLGFFFSFTKKGKEISFLLITKLDEMLPKKKD